MNTPSSWVRVLLTMVAGAGSLIVFFIWRPLPSKAPIVVSPNASSTQSVEPAPISTIGGASAPAHDLIWPLERAEDRITKKPFGIKVSPTDSPVSPEKFSGYHTAVDFETFPEEADSTVVVKAVCSGELRIKRAATGYGGIAVQSCTVHDQAVTIIYGHLKLSSISATVGQSLKQGETLAVLGKGFSSETDGERKHLHLGIHTGTAVDIRGYVPTADALKGWIAFKPD